MFNSTRRSKNIGTSKQGYGQDNKLIIPESWHDARVFYEKLNRPICIKKSIQSKTFIFLVEPTLIDFTHSCTVDDVAYVLELLPRDDVKNIDLIVFRQAKRKEVILNNVWGRLAFFYETTGYEGTAIIVEAQQISKPLRWNKSLIPECQRELLRLENDGHKITKTKKNIVIHSTVESCRSTQLYRTIPHEIGHYVDNLENENKFDLKSAKDKEDFAHRYADEFKKTMISEGKIPFPRILNKNSIQEDRLEVKWFE